MSRERAPVSVIVPVYNGERYLAEALESILAQTRPPLEILLVDDGSSDGSARVAEGFAPRVTVLRRPANEGVTAALRTGIAAATAEHLAFLDSDDTWAPAKLERQMEALAAEPELEAVFGHVRQFLAAELDDEARRRLRPPAEVLPGHVIGAMLLRRAAYARVGELDATLRNASFIDWLARAQETKLRSAMLPDVLLHRRIHGANMGLGSPDARVPYARIMKGILDRRRRKPAG